MRQALLAVVAVTAVVAVGGAARSVAVRGVEAERYGRLPVVFESNRGQAPGEVAFLARGSGYAAFLARRGLTLRLESGQAKPTTVSVAFPNGAAPAPTGEAALPGKVSYLVGRDRGGWLRGVPTYARVRQRNVYRGIDLVYHGDAGGLEYDFVVAPGADPAAIRLRFSGQRRLRLDAHGSLLLTLPGGTLVQKRPVAYQQSGTRRSNVASRYVLGRNGDVRVALGPYDGGRPLVIDPTVAYGSYWGGSDDDQANGIAVDASGNVYVTGITRATNYPVKGAIQPTAAGGNWDAFVTKLDPSGTQFVYSTYLGGAGDDTAHRIAVDVQGNAYVVGETDSGNFPTAAPFQPTKRGATDVFVSKLNPSGSALVYSTYLGGRSYEWGADIAVDLAGGVYVTGTVGSLDFPTASPFQAQGAGDWDAFVAKLRADGSALEYSTYLGGKYADDGTGIAVDATGAAYVSGYTYSPNFPLQHAFQPTLDPNSRDVFITKLDPAGSALVYSSYLGGNGEDALFGASVAVDPAGNAYLTGATGSTNFPTKNAVQTTHGGGQYDGFVSKVNADGSALAYSTYLGGNANDFPYGLAVDAAGNAYVTGPAYSSNFPTYDPLPNTTIHPASFLTKLTTSGAFGYSTYLRTGSTDPFAVAADAAGNAYVTGYDFFYGPNGPDSDVFVTKIVPSPPTAVELLAFDVRRDGALDELRWRVGTAAGLLGFNVYRAEASARERLNRRLISARPGVRSYRFRVRTRAGASVRYWLELIHADGRRTRHGPVMAGRAQR